MSHIYPLQGSFTYAALTHDTRDHQFNILSQLNDIQLAFADSQMKIAGKYWVIHIEINLRPLVQQSLDHPAATNNKCHLNIENVCK